jgi:type IV pilus assembly protein PilO
MPLKNRNLAIAAAALGLICVIFYAYYSLVYAPLGKTIEQDHRTVADLTQKLDLARARAGQLSKIQAEMAGLQVDVAQLEKQLPKDRELPSLIRVFTHRAEAFGVALSSFAPQRLVPKGLYDEIPYAVTMTTSFHSLGRFLTAMGKGERLFAARNLALTSAVSKSDNTKTINATFTLVSFKYHE